MTDFKKTAEEILKGYHHNMACEGITLINNDHESCTCGCHALERYLKTGNILR